MLTATANAVQLLAADFKTKLINGSEPEIVDHLQEFTGSIRPSGVLVVI